jgi:LysR family hydrogen peroxide-inducible transcriptional activator
MEMHQLRYFAAVAHTGNFSRAAERCHVSQPSLSQQIQKLERHLGQRLFDRLGRKAVLTAAGRALLERTATILAAVDDARQHLKEFNPLEGGSLAVGAIPTIAPYILPATLERFARRCPHVELTIHEDVTQRLVEAIAGGELDLALAARTIHDDRLDVCVLYTEPLLLALPAGHRLVKRRRITLEDIRGERFILLDEMHCLGEQILSFCNDKGCRRIACRSTQLSTMQHLIALGQGISLLPAMASNEETGARVVYRPLAPESPSRTLVTIWRRHRHRSIAAERFVEDLNEVAAKMSHRQRSERKRVSAPSE